MEASLRISAAAAHFFAWFSVVFCSIVAKRQVIRIDTHAHFVPPFYYDLVVANGLRSIEWSAADHLQFMDSMNIQLAVLSISTPGARLTPFDVERGRKVARQLTEYGQMLTMAYPERFRFLAALALPGVEGSVEEAIYALDTLNAAGVALLANSQGEYLGSKKFDPLMEVLNDRHATVFVHPSHLDASPVTTEVRGELLEVPTYIMDFLLDTTRAAANLVIANVTGRYPNIKFILAHSGGFIPFAAYRMSVGMEMFMGANPERVLAEYKKFYVDTALSSSLSALPSKLQFIPKDQITFGTDYPYAPTPVIRRFSKAFDEYPLEDKLRRQINFDSAQRLFEEHLSLWRHLVWH
ncbi:unnamed protein product [Calypogeia fissa]